MARSARCLGIEIIIRYPNPGYFVFSIMIRIRIPNNHAEGILQLGILILGIGIIIRYLIPLWPFITYKY